MGLFKPSKEKIDKWYADGRKALKSRDISTAINLLTKAYDNGRTDAAYPLAVCYDIGVNGKPDDAEKFKWLKISAESGNVDGMAGYASALHSGKGCQADKAAGLAWFKKAADGGDVFSSAFYGSLLFEGKQLPKDMRQAYKYLHYAAMAGYEGIESMLGVLYYNNQDDMFGNNLELAEYWISRAARRGMNNTKETLEDIHRAIVKKNESAARQLGDNVPVRPWDSNLVNFYDDTDWIGVSRSAKEGNVADMTRLAKYTFDLARITRFTGRDVDNVLYSATVDIVLEAMEIGTAAARAGDTEAMRTVAKAYINSDYAEQAAGSGLEYLTYEDCQKRCVQWLETAAKAGNIEAMVDLAELLQKKDFSKMYPGRCETWCEKLKSLGDPRGAYFESFLDEKSDDEKAALLDEAASKYYGPAFTRYAKMLEDEREFENAMNWYYGAALLGEPAAMLALSELFESDDVGIEDLEMSAYWCEEAAKRGDVYAMYSMALIYSNKDYGPIDLAYAKLWIDRAIERVDDPDSYEEYEELQSKIIDKMNKRH